MDEPEFSGDGRIKRPVPPPEEGSSRVADPIRSMGSGAEKISESVPVVIIDRDKESAVELEWRERRREVVGAVPENDPGVGALELVVVINVEVSGDHDEVRKIISVEIADRRPPNRIG